MNLCVWIPEQDGEVVDVESEISNSGQDWVAGFRRLRDHLFDFFPIHLKGNMKKWDSKYWDLTLLNTVKGMQVYKCKINENIVMSVYLKREKNQSDLVRDGRSNHHQGLVNQVGIHFDEFSFVAILKLILLKLRQSLSMVQPVKH